jgi:hypothetical protein
MRRAWRQLNAGRDYLSLKASPIPAVGTSRKVLSLLQLSSSLGFLADLMPRCVPVLTGWRHVGFAGAWL